MVPALVIHGGAGAIGDLGRLPQLEAGARLAAEAGLSVLRAGGTALDAVQVAVRALEDDPEFNAGVGSCLTRDGGVEVDAAIMDGEHLRIGAVGAVPNLRQPVDLARMLLDAGEHILLVGDGAWRYARERGLAPVDPEVMITSRMRARLEEDRARRAAGEVVHTAELSGGTVGACAIDARGHVAAATSTGGMSFKRAGRVGDTPIPGAGTYADDGGGAASATGHGERIIQVGVTRTAVEHMRRGASAHDAAWAAIDEIGARTHGEAGVICVDRDGRIGIAHNSKHMTHAWGTTGEAAPHVGVKQLRS